MAVTLGAAGSFDRDRDDLALISYVRVSNAVAHFAQSLPFRVRCSDDLGVGLTWAERNVALRHRELAPDPPGWKTALRFDVDCPCDRQPHARSGYCPRAATYWRDAMVAEPSFVVVNPSNGHAHYIYLLRGWIRVDGTNPTQLAAVRYFAAIEHAYTRALHADPGYAGLVQHNPFAACYETFNGRDEPYSLRELASFVELPRLASRRTAEIRTDGRNVETFDRLRYWAYGAIAEYRCGSRETWEEVVDARAQAIAVEVRAAHPAASHPFSDQEVRATAKSVAGWVWSRYDGGSLTRMRADAAVRRENDRKRDLAARRERGCVPRDVYLAEVQRRRVVASTLRGLGVAIDEIARRLGAGVRSVHRWISEIRCVPSPSAPSDFAPRPTPDPSSPKFVSSSRPSDGDNTSLFFGPHGASVEDRCEYGPPAQSAEPAIPRASAGEGGGAREETGVAESPIAYIQRRIREIVAKHCDPLRPP
jgi:hypothetical protein